jgi:polyadenylate-binding protein
MGYGQPGMMPPRPCYPPNNGKGMPIPAPYGQAPPQGYGMPRGVAPRPPGGHGGPGSSPTNPNVPMPCANGPVPPNGATPCPGPPPAASTNRPPAGAPALTARPGQQYKLNPQTRNA